MKRVIKSRWSGAKLAPHQKFETMSHLVDCTLVEKKKKKKYRSTARVNLYFVLFVVSWQKLEKKKINK